MEYSGKFHGSFSPRSSHFLHFLSNYYQNPPKFKTNQSLFYKKTNEINANQTTSKSLLSARFRHQIPKSVQKFHQIPKSVQVSPMAGTLPGVECARRRRCHQNKLRSDSPPIAAAPALTRRSVLCLYTSNHETLLASNLTLQRSLLVEAQEEDDKLDGVAREAKRRLDERLRSQRKLKKDKKVELDRVELDRRGATKFWLTLGLKTT